MVFHTDTRHLANDIDKKCPSIKFFRPNELRDKGGLNHEEENSEPEFCPLVRTTCCSDSDFRNIKNWWQEDTKYSKTGNTRVTLRTFKLSYIGALTKAIISRFFTPLRKKATDIFTNKNSDKECLSNAAGIMEFKEEKVKDYSKTAQKCWKFTGTLQNTL